MRAQRGFTLVETAIGVAIAVLVAAGVYGATLASARVVQSPVTRDQLTLSIRNAIVEARAASAYDAAAVSAILSGPPSQTGASSGTSLSTKIENGALVFAATSGGETVQMRYPVAQEALPQGAIVDAQGNAAGP